MLDLHGENFGDGIVGRLDDAPLLWSLAMQGTTVTTEGLKSLDKTSPLWSLDLSDTEIDDDVFAILNNYKKLGLINLSGTQLTGSGIRQLRGSLHRLDLGNTRFESKYLVDLFAPNGEEATLWNELLLQDLSIRNTQFDEDSSETLVALTKTINSLD